MVTQAAHALPHAPMGPSAAMQLAAGLHLAPPKKPAVPDWVRQELLKRGMQNDASGGMHELVVLSVSHHATVAWDLVFSHMLAVAASAVNSTRDVSTVACHIGVSSSKADITAACQCVIHKMINSQQQSVMCRNPSTPC